MVKEFEEVFKDVFLNIVVNKVIKIKFGYYVVFVKENNNN